MGLRSTSEELEELKKVFIGLDKSGDGVLSLEEIKDGMEQAMGSMKGNA